MSDAAPNTVNFRELLSQPTDTVERPKSLPNGHYLGVIIGHEFDRSRNKQTPYVRFAMKVDGPTSDVPDGACAGIDFSRRELRKDYFITPNALYRLSDMLDAVLGKTTGKSFDERIPNTRSQRVIIGVTARLNEDGTDSGFNDVTTIVAA